MRHPFHFCDVRHPPAAWETRVPAESGIALSHAALTTDNCLYYTA